MLKNDINLLKNDKATLIIILAISDVKKINSTNKLIFEYASGVYVFGKYLTFTIDFLLGAGFLPYNKNTPSCFNGESVFGKLVSFL